MAEFEKDEVPMLSDTHPKLSNEPGDSKFQRLVPRTRSVSISIPMIPTDPCERDANLVGHTGPLRSQKKTSFNPMSGPLYVTHRTENLFGQNIVAPGSKAVESNTEKFPFCGMSENDFQNNNYASKNEHLVRSGPLGMCNDPYCTVCPTYIKATQPRDSKALGLFNPKFHNAIYGDAKDWARRIFFLIPHVPRVINPHTRLVQQWNKFFAICCLLAIFVDPLFFFLLSVHKEDKCIVINKTMTTVLVVLRSINDLIHLLNIILQFRLAYVAPESRVVGAGELVDHPNKIALHYLQTYFVFDLFVVLPLPQIIILFVLPTHLGSSGANYAKNLLRAVVLVQYIPRLCRFLPMLISPTGFIFESAWTSFFINLFTFMLSGHVVGSWWYLFGLQRVNQCLRNACNTARFGARFGECSKFIDCGHGNTEGYQNDTNWIHWKKNANASACFTEDGFEYGIYLKAVNLTTRHNVFTRYVYSSFWGFQQISTLAGNLNPSYFVWEVLFTMAIIGLGLLLFALLIGNIQNFLQALGRRRLERSLRQRDVEQWMSHRRLAGDLRRRVRQAEHYNWAATRGVNEEMLMENFPEDLQRDIRRHLFKFVRKIRIFALMDEPILDAICERLRQKIYIKGSKILYDGGLVEKVVFIVRGKLESIGEDGIRVPLSEGNVCGEELLTWYLEHPSGNKDGGKTRIPRQRLVSYRTVLCLTNVEAFSLRAEDLEEVTSIFARFLRSPRVQGAIRCESPYWRCLAATRIQVAWRYRMKRLSRAYTSQSNNEASKL